MSSYRTGKNVRRRQRYTRHHSGEVAAFISNRNAERTACKEQEKNAPVDPNHSQDIMNVKIVKAQRPHWPSVSRLADEIYPNTSGWPVPVLEKFSSYFEDGQLVALDMGTNEVIGAALNIIVDWPADTPKYLDLIRSALSCPKGASKKHPVVYAADLMVSPAFRRKGIGRMLIASRMQVVRERGLFVTRGSARLSSPGSNENKLNQEYLRRVALGLEINPVLSFVVQSGGELVAPLKDHFDPSEDKCPHAVLTQFWAPSDSLPVPCEIVLSQAKEQSP